MNSLPILIQYLKTKFARSFSSRESLERWQEKNTLRFLKKTVPRSPYYQEQFSGRSLTDWRTLPTIDKTVMMNQFDRFNTLGIIKADAMEVALGAEKERAFTEQLKGITVGLSSGTSGSRGLFLVSKREEQKWVGTLLAKILPGPLYQRHRMALFLRANSNLYTGVEKGKIQFRFFDLFGSVQENVRDVEEYQPTILVAPPSMLRFLAQYKQEGTIQLQPEKIISVAEVLDPLDEAFIHHAFGQTVHQIYQCTEGLLATTCSFGTLHVNEDLLIMEKQYLNKQLGKFSPIITDFTRTSQPMIRYLLNDILTEKRESCPCGSPFLAIEQIEGRCDDLFYFSQEGNTHLKPIFPDFIRRAILIAGASIEEYMVIQHDPHHVEVQLKVHEEKKKEAEDAVRQSLYALFVEQSCVLPHITWTPYTHLPGPVKLRRVKRVFPVKESSF